MIICIYVVPASCMFTNYCYFRREKNQSAFAFYAEGESQGSVKVTKDGKGFLRVWRQQLQQFRNVSPQIAAAIYSAYPSPRQLLEVIVIKLKQSFEIFLGPPNFIFLNCMPIAP